MDDEYKTPQELFFVEYKNVNGGLSISSQYTTSESAKKTASALDHPIRILRYELKDWSLDCRSAKKEQPTVRRVRSVKE